MSDTAPTLPSPDFPVGREEWPSVYGIPARTLNRWLARGTAKGTPCPLAYPAQMPDWLDRCLDKVHASIREKILAAAARYRTPAAGTAPAPAPAPDTPLPPVDLTLASDVDADSAATFRRIFHVTREQLVAAYRAGNDDQIRTLTTRLDRVGESLRKHEKAAEEKAKRNGEWLPRADVLADITTAFTLISQLIARLPARLADDLPELAPEHRTRLAGSAQRFLEQVRTRLAQAPALRGTDDPSLFSLS